MRDSVEMVKEQLRMQAKELKRRDAEKAKHDAKIKHVLKLSQEKIEILKTSVKEKEEEILNKQFSGAKLTFDASKGSKEENAEDAAEREHDQALIKDLKSQLEQSGRDREKLAKDLKKASKTKDTPEKVVETNEIIKEVKDPKLIKALRKLKLKNQALTDRLEERTGDQNKNDKEKELLAQEVQRLRKQPDAADQLKKKIKQQEKKHEESIKSYEKMIKEKSDLIDSYEKVMYETKGEEGKTTKLPSEMIKDLKADIEKIEVEKDRLEQDLLREKKEFDNKLSLEIQKIEDEWEDRLKKSHAKKNNDGSGDQEMEDEGAPLWMITYADMVTLLLTFFILYYSIASMNMQKFKEEIGRAHV